MLNNQIEQKKKWERKTSEELFLQNIYLLKLIIAFNVELILYYYSTRAGKNK